MPFITTSVGGGSGQGSALNYQQNVVSPVTVSDNGALITGVEMMTTGKPVQISVTGEAENDTAGSWIVIQLHDSNTPIGNAIQLEASAVSENVPYALNFIHTPEAGGHDFNLKVVSKSPGTWTFGEVGGPVFNAVELTGFKGDDGLSANVGNFEFNNGEMSTNEEMIISVNTVPGSITASAYNGLELQFADEPGAGLRFPDGSIQTTAYTGGTDSPKTWTASNNTEYKIIQAHGGTEVTTDAQQLIESTAVGYGNQLNSYNFPLIIADSNMNDILVAINDGSLHSRRIRLFVNGLERQITVSTGAGPSPAGWVWYFNSDYAVTLTDMATYNIDITYGSSPVVWWDAATLGFDIPDNNFRGAKIDYHAFIPDAGTMIGTIYIASDAGDTHVSHIETGSGGNDLGTASWWYRKNGWQEEERRLYFYRTDGEANTHKIQWTAQLYYASESWD